MKFLTSKRAGIAAACTFALSGCGGGSGSNLSTPSGADGTIFYISSATRNPDGTGTNGDIFAADSNGKNKRRITTTPESEGYFDVSFDGRTIVYQANPGGLRVMNSDGTGSRPLQGAGGSLTPKISSDGRAVLTLSSSLDLYSVKVDGSNQKQLAPGYKHTLSNYAFNSDGTRIAFVIDGTKLGAPSGTTPRPAGIYTMAADGTDIRLALLAASSTSGTSRGFGIGLDYGANGVIVTGVTEETSGNRQSGILVVRDDGTDERIIATPGEQAYYPTLSPDGTEVAYDSFINDQPTARIYIHKVDGSNRRLFSDFGAFPSWGAKAR